MPYADIIGHARTFASFIETHQQKIHDVLRKYESWWVVDDEIRRSVDSLQRIRELGKYFPDVPLSEKTTVFLPLNLPLYSFVLFGVMPAFQSRSLIIRVPARMDDSFGELLEVLEASRFFPTIQTFKGSREEFVSEHCASASVVLFTGRYNNYLRIQRACRKDTLILYNGVGHNPLVITPSADIELAVTKALQVKTYNSGQDCAGPDMLLVHREIIDVFSQRLTEELGKTRCGTSYDDKDVIVGPLFESSVLLDAVKLVSELRRQGALICHGGQFDLNHNVMYPCVVRTTLRKTQSFVEQYSPLFLVAEYEHDQELALYFEDENSQYQNSEMYISLFGESDYVSRVQGSIVLKDCTIHDVERGTQEYGGYSPQASSVSYGGLLIPKPLLVPREIHNFLSPGGKRIFAAVPDIKGNWEQQVVATDFQRNVREIFDDNLIFAYIFGSFASGKDKRYSDIDTFLCVRTKESDQIERYLDWLFATDEMFGRIPDFKYPCEIATFEEMAAAAERLATTNLSAGTNEVSMYDAMVWFHALSQIRIGVLGEENIPDHWKQLFPVHSLRLLRSFLEDLERRVVVGEDMSKLRPEIHEIPRKEPGVSRFINNLKGRGLVHVLKMIAFEEKPIFTDIVLKLVSRRKFIGRQVFRSDTPDHLLSPYFRFGVVGGP